MNIKPIEKRRCLVTISQLLVVPTVGILAVSDEFRGHFSVLVSIEASSRHIAHGYQP